MQIKLQGERYVDSPREVKFDDYDNSHQLLSTLPSINYTHHDPDYATSSSHDFCFAQHIYNVKYHTVK